MSSYGISCQSAWDSMTCNPPQHTPIYSLHTPNWMRQPDNTHWISEYLAFACHHGSSHSGKKNLAFYWKKKKTLAPFLLSIPSCSLGNVLYWKKKCSFCLPLFSQVSFMVLPLPALSKDESLSCAFGALPAEPAIVENNRISCQSPPPMLLPPSPPGSGEWLFLPVLLTEVISANCWPVNMQFHTGE